MFFQDKQMKSDSTKNIDTEILANHKKKEREATKQGKRPFYLKKCNPCCHALFHLQTDKYMLNALMKHHYICWHPFPFLAAEIRKQRLIEKYNQLKVYILEHLFVFTPAPTLLYHLFTVFSAKSVHTSFLVIWQTWSICGEKEEKECCQGPQIHAVS